MSDTKPPRYWLEMALASRHGRRWSSEHLTDLCNAADSNLHRCLVLMGGADMRLSEAVQLLRECGYIDEKESGQ